MEQRSLAADFFSRHIFGITLVVAVLCFHGFNQSKQQKQKIKSLYDRVSVVADVDKRDGTSGEEWGKVYDELGIKFNPLEPQRLSVSDMERYLANHGQSYNPRQR